MPEVCSLCCMASTSEVGRQIPKLGSQDDGDLKDLGQAGTGTPASVPWCFHASGWTAPSEEKTGSCKVISLPFFSPSPPWWPVVEPSSVLAR